MISRSSTSRDRSKRSNDGQTARRRPPMSTAAHNLPIIFADRRIGGNNQVKLCENSKYRREMCRNDERGLSAARTSIQEYPVQPNAEYRFVLELMHTQSGDEISRRYNTSMRAPTQEGTTCRLGGTEISPQFKASHRGEILHMHQFKTEMIFWIQVLEGARRWPNPNVGPVVRVASHRSVSHRFPRWFRRISLSDSESAHRESTSDRFTKKILRVRS
jgi:hypothetical protein